MTGNMLLVPLIFSEQVQQEKVKTN